MARELTDRQKKFLAVLMDEAGGDITSAKIIAGYSANTSNTEITMMTFTTDDPKRCGVVKIDNSGIIQEFHEKVQNPPSTTANGAVYIVETSVISYMERLKKVKVDFSVDVLPYYMGRIFTYYNGHYHRDIGNIRSYELAQLETNFLYSKNS